MAEQFKDDQDARIDRRAMLRRGGGVIAGAAGATAIGAVVAPSAQAAPGESVVQGSVNNAADTSTMLTSSGTGASLVLQNTRSPAIAAALRLGESAGTEITGSFTAGELYSVFNEFLQIHVASGELVSAGFVHTSSTSNTLVPIDPIRVVDTRNSAGRQRIMNPSALDANGRVKAGQAIKVDLSPDVQFGTAVNCNLTAVNPLAKGFLALIPEYAGGQPATSSLNFVAGQVIANFAVAPIGHQEGGDYVYIYAHQTSHVLLDATGFVVGDWSQVIGNPGPHPQALAVQSAGDGTSKGATIPVVESKKAASQ